MSKTRQNARKKKKTPIRKPKAASFKLSSHAGTGWRQIEGNTIAMYYRGRHVGEPMTVPDGTRISVTEHEAGAEWLVDDKVVFTYPQVKPKD